MVKNVIFDIGNVILKFNRDYLLSHFYQGDEYEFLKEKVFYNWEELDEDLISLEDYNKRVLNSLPPHLHAPAMAVLNNWEYYMSHVDGIVDLIRELKLKGYNLYVLSNMTRHFIPNEYRFPIFKEFDGIVYSAPIGIIKPNPKIFEYIINKFNLTPEKTVFIDDIKENLAAAARFKIKTFHFNNNTNSLREFILSL